MQNLLEETLRELGVKTIDEAIPLIEWSNLFMEFKENRALAPSHTDAECAAFLSAMSEEYDPFEQEVSGTIMLKDGTWLDRIEEWDEYEDEDGNEYSDWLGWEWVHCKPISPEWVPQFDTCITH